MMGFIRQRQLKPLMYAEMSSGRSTLPSLRAAGSSLVEAEEGALIVSVRIDEVM